MPILSKKQIFASTLKTEEVEVPSWGGSVLVGEFSVARRNELLGRLLDENGKSRAITPPRSLTERRWSKWPSFTTPKK